ncbi:hypothetical protein GT370_04295 [Acidocella sp. MX-AZ03]|uniref:hypothetical protein n=1 Tax=Acidocella sp. MX-AZ03 TaxID=2697363 RepID=UPI0022DE7DDD|nr:hypothetical protein [Acidocella sp. MX-AZ03]WBO60077.1 hypothetical protein GT370_04295 [Acidocella sp. MX-AZ03]
MAKLDPHTPSGPAFMGANFDPEAAMRQFQARTANLLQAQERLFQGLGRRCARRCASARNIWPAG